MSLTQSAQLHPAEIWLRDVPALHAWIRSELGFDPWPSLADGPRKWRCGKQSAFGSEWSGGSSEAVVDLRRGAMRGMAMGFLTVHGGHSIEYLRTRSDAQIAERLQQWGDAERKKNANGSAGIEWSAS